MRDKKRAHLARRRERPAVGQRTAGVDRDLPFEVAPSPDGVVVLETEAERIHVAVTGGAGGIAAMPFELLARGTAHASARVFERRNVARRRLGRRAEDVLQHILAADDG